MARGQLTQSVVVLFVKEQTEPRIVLTQSDEAREMIDKIRIAQNAFKRIGHEGR